MAVSDWSADPRENVMLGRYRLDGEFGGLFAELMAEFKAEIDSIKADAESAGEAIQELEAAMGSWSDETETTAVKPAIEALRPEPETVEEGGE